MALAVLSAHHSEAAVLFRVVYFLPLFEKSWIDCCLFLFDYVDNESPGYRLSSLKTMGGFTVEQNIL